MPLPEMNVILVSALVYCMVLPLTGTTMANIDELFNANRDKQFTVQNAECLTGIRGCRCGALPGATMCVSNTYCRGVHVASNIPGTGFGRRSYVCVDNEFVGPAPHYLTGDNSVFDAFGARTFASSPCPLRSSCYDCVARDKPIATFLECVWCGAQCIHIDDDRECPANVGIDRQHAFHCPVAPSRTSHALEPMTSASAFASSKTTTMNSARTTSNIMQTPSKPVFIAPPDPLTETTIIAVVVSVVLLALIIGAVVVFVVCRRLSVAKSASEIAVRNSSHTDADGYATNVPAPAMLYGVESDDYTTNIPAPATLYNGEVQFQCPSCKQAYATAEDLDIHKQKRRH